jgi:signal transduction histidine kinase
VNTRIIMPFLLAIIAIAGIGVYIVTQLVAGSIQERFTNQLLDSADSAANSIVDVEREQIGTLRLMAFTDGVADAVADGAADDLDTWLRPIAANNRLDEFIIVDGGGETLLHLSRQDTVAGVEYVGFITETADWEIVQRILQGSADRLGDKHVEVIETGDQTVFYFGAPVIQESGETVGGVLVGIRAGTLSRFVSQQSLSNVTLTAPDGHVFSSTFRSNLDDLRLEEGQAASLMTQVQNESPIEEIRLGGTPYQVLYSPLRLRSQHIGLLSVGLPSNFIVERSSTSRDVFGLLFASLFVLVGSSGLLVARTITRPIQRLVTTTRAIRSGDFTQRVRLHTPDELGELASSFDSMTDDLVQRNEEISELYHQQVLETAQRDAVLASISDAVIVQDLTGEILLHNRTADQLMKSIMRDRSERELFIELRRHPNQLAEPRMVFIQEHYYSVLATPVRMASGERIGHVIVFRDITAIIRAEKLKDELVLQMSHELRTPLSAVRGYIDLVNMFDQSRLSSQGGEFMGNAVDNLTVLERLVNQVIDVSAMISNRFHIDVETFNLAYVLNDSYNTWKPTMEKRGLRLSLDVPSSNMWIEADEERIAELIDHLLRNAYNYTLQDGMVEIGAEINSDRVLISIADSGVGIDHDEISRVFDRMYRGRSADAGPTDARGLGLGLYISQQIVDAHQGTIMIESQRNLGTIVTVGLPVKHPRE